MNLPDRRRPASTARVRGGDALRWVVSGSRVVVGGVTTVVRMARRGQLRDTLRPWLSFDRVEEVPFELLASQGVRACLFDLENTLIPPGGPFTDDGRAVLASVRAAGMTAGVVSNCSAAWARRALEAEGLPYVCPAHKPSKNAFLEACRLVGVKPSQAVYIGDQMITDVFGAQRAGMRAILLQPQHDGEALSAKFQRLVSKGLLRLVGR